MKRYFLSIFAAAFVISSCVQDIKVETEDELPGDEDVEVVVPESQELSITAGNATKTVLDSDGHIRWESGDQLSVVFNHETEGASVSGDFKTEFEDGPALTAIFSGTFDADLDGENYNGYQNAFAVYPHTAVDEGGSLVFELPVTQTAVEGGSFAKGYNLSSSALSLDEVMTGSATAAFKNALTFLRFKVDDAVKSITFTGTAPLAGGAPLAVYFSTDPEDQKDHGRLVLQPEGAWSKPSESVTLVPETGCENFQSGGSHQYNLLIWPGTHNSLKITLDYGEPYGTYDLINNFGGKPKEFSVNKYYNLNFPSDLASILSNAEKKIEIVEKDIDDFSYQLDSLENQVGGLVNQIQSVSFLSEYTENLVYARYAPLQIGTSYLDLDMDFMIRPASAAQELLDRCSEQGNLSDVFKMLVYEKNGNTSYATVRNASLDGDILSVKVAPLYTDFYTNNEPASMALQISDEYTKILSDFTSILPKKGALINMTKSDGIPVMMDANASIPFTYGANDKENAKLSIECEGFPDDRTPGLSYDGSSGHVTASFKAGDNLEAMRITLRLTDGEDEFVVPMTFKDAGSFVVSHTPFVEYIGGEANVEVIEKDDSAYGSYSMQVLNTMQPGTYKDPITGNTISHNGYQWIRDKNQGVYGSYIFEENGPRKIEITVKENDVNVTKEVDLEYNYNQERIANIRIDVPNAKPGENGAISYSRTVSIPQKAYGSAIDLSNYYTDGECIELRSATSQTQEHLNLVILGDGYTQSQLQKGGVFYNRANSAADVFLNAIDEEFRDRFNVYMLVRESVNAGNANDVTEATSGYTYYQTYKTGGGTNVNISGTGKQRVISDVESICTRASYDFYRTVALLLINVNIDGGSSDYEFNNPISTSYVGDGYANFAYSMIPANTSGFGGLVRHESVGHCLGRLGDEYYVDWYTRNLVTERHGYGFYSNIALDKTEWQIFKEAEYNEDEVGYYYYKNGDSYVTEGNNLIYRSTNDSGLMFDSQKGSFNAVSRWAIYDRIRKQTEGPGDYWSDFLTWDEKNR